MATERNPENTRQRILKSAFNVIHCHGYQGFRIESVLSETGLKKGALYHHFTSKRALAYAVLEELIQKRITDLWLNPLEKFDNPIEGIKTTFLAVGETWGDKFFSLGCPLNNLAQEMSPIDEGFRISIEEFFSLWQQTIASSLKRGQDLALVKQDINLDETARFIITIIEGAFGQAKVSQSRDDFFKTGHQLSRYLDTLTN